MKRKIYEPVRDFRTPIPEAFADKLARRAEAVFAKHALSSTKWRRGMGRGGASSIAPLSGSLPVGRGERVKAFWWRRFQNRDTILKFMRHWLAGVLARERPALFRDLPESFKIGRPLPEKPRSSGRESAPSSRPQNQSRFTSAATVSRAGSRGRSPHHMVHRFVHGYELPTV